MKCEACGYKFLFASSTQCPSCGDLREAIVAMNDSVLSPGTAAQETAKQFVCAGNWCKHLSECNEAQECQIALQRTAAQYGYNFLTANLTPQASQSSGLQGIDQQAIAQSWNNALQAVPIMDSVVGLKAANAHLTRQLAAQALAHAEQMEGARGGDYAQVRAELSNMCEIAIDQAKRIASLDTALKISETRTYIAEGRVAELEMRGTPTTQPTDAQQTASDVKAAPERRPDGTLKPVAKAWEAPKQASDARRIGG